MCAVPSWFITFALRGHYDVIINVDNTEEEKRETLSTSPGLGLLGPLLVVVLNTSPCLGEEDTCPIVIEKLSMLLEPSRKGVAQKAVQVMVPNLQE